jgi:hypothetical protein
LIGHTLVTSGGNLDGAGYGGFGITPDETALTTLGVLLLIRAPRVYFLLPLLWCTMGALTLYAMTAPISE